MMLSVGYRLQQRGGARGVVGCGRILWFKDKLQGHIGFYLMQLVYGILSCGYKSIHAMRSVRNQCLHVGNFTGITMLTCWEFYRNFNINMVGILQIRLPGTIRSISTTCNIEVILNMHQPDYRKHY